VAAAAREQVLPTGSMHLVFRLSDALMLADEFPEFGIRGPEAIGGTSVTLHLHVDNADAVIRRAAEAGARVEREPKDEFHGERSGAIRDPFGHRWSIGHRIEDVSPEEMQRRYDALLKT
jgi:PhnB protein